MTAALRDEALQRCCDVLDAVAPTAPTRCEGWDAHDLAVHLWLLHHDPISWPGLLPPFQQWGALRGARVRRRWPYDDLVNRLRTGPAGFACMPFDGREDHRHSMGEYVVHTQDVARANGVVQPAFSAVFQDALWLRLQVAARQLHRRRTPGLVFARPDGQRVQVTEGAPDTVVTGEPLELMCWVYGRGAVADVTVTGP